MTARGPIAGLALSSGGARGAYQAGVLRAIGEYAPKGANPFPVLSGVSAGSLNAAYLAAGADDFKAATGRLAELWKGLRPHDIFRTDGFTLSRTGLGWITDLSLGGFFGSGRARSLLDTAPLRVLLDRVLDHRKIDANFAAGLVRGLAISATNYSSGTAVSFFEGVKEIEPWVRSTRMGMRTRITVDHLMASSAIPVFFPAVSLEGSYYGDGSIRLTTPLSPTIHMGADRVLAIGIRRKRDEATTTTMNKTAAAPKYPMVADVGGVLLNSMFLDGLEADIERMERINQTLRLIPPERIAEHPSALREIPVMAIRPSQDLGSLVAQTIDSFPFTVRHLLKGLGASQERGWDLLSYLAFDTSYTTPVAALGFEDGMQARHEISEFLGW